LALLGTVGAADDQTLLPHCCYVLRGVDDEH
jgi:hypothetical protein